MNEVSTEKVEGAKPHEYVFSIKDEGDYELHFTMSQGWNSVILGGVTLTTQPSVADVYKGGFLRLMKEAAQGYEATADGRYAASEDLRAALGAVLEQYEGFASTAPSAYEAAIEAVEAAWRPLAERKESVDLYTEAMETAQDTLSEWEKNGFDLTVQAYLDLKEAVQAYAPDRMDMTDNQRMRDAAESLAVYVQALQEVPALVAVSSCRTARWTWNVMIWAGARSSPDTGEWPSCASFIATAVPRRTKRYGEPLPVRREGMSL